jgi:hypothetical protein
VLGKPAPSDPAMAAAAAVGYIVFIFLRVGVGGCTAFACCGRRVHRDRMVQSLEFRAWTAGKARASWAWAFVILSLLYYLCLSFTVKLHAVLLIKGARSSPSSRVDFQDQMVLLVVHMPKYLP